MTIAKLDDLRKAYKRAKALDAEYGRVFKRNADAQDLGMRPLRSPAFLSFCKDGIAQLVESTVEHDLNVRPKDCESRMEQYARLFTPDPETGETEYSAYLPNGALCVFVDNDSMAIGLPDGLTRGKTVANVLSQEDAPESIILPILFVDEEQVELIRRYVDSNRTRDMVQRVELILNRGKKLTGDEKKIVCRGIKVALAAAKDDHGGRLVFTPKEIEEAATTYRKPLLDILATEDFLTSKDQKAKLLRSATGIAGLVHVYQASPEVGKHLIESIDSCLAGKCSDTTIQRLWAWLGGRLVQSTEAKETLFRALTYIGKQMIVGIKLEDGDKVCSSRNYLKDADVQQAKLGL